MPIKIEIEAANYEDLVKEVAKVLGLAYKGRGILVDPELPIGNGNLAITEQSMPDTADRIAGVGRATKRAKTAAKSSALDVGAETPLIAGGLPAEGEANVGSATSVPSPTVGSPAADPFPTSSPTAPATTAAASAASAVTSIFNIDDVKAKLKEVSGKSGLKTVVSILNAHGLVGSQAQYMNLKPEQYASVIEASNKAMAS